MKWTIGIVLSLAMLPAAQAQYSLTFLHNNDAESELFGTGPNGEFGGVARFATMLNQTRDFYSGIGHGVIAIASGDTFLPGPEFQASLDSGMPGARQIYDAQAMSQIGYDAVIIGNHEFDYGPDVLSEFIDQAQLTNPTTFLSANLDFGAQANLNSQLMAGLIAPSKLVSVPTSNGMKNVGIIGATTENLPFISSPGAVAVNSVANAVNAQIADLQASGADHIVLASHLQGISEDESLIPMLNPGIDLILAGGGDDRLATAGAPSPATVNPGAPASVVDTGFVGSDVGELTYPVMSATTDLGGNAIPLVSTDANFKYLGRVTLNVDAAGAVSVDASSNPQRVADVSADSTHGVMADPNVLSTIAPVQTYVDNLASTIIGSTSGIIVGGGSSDLIRSDERAGGNLVTDAFLAKANQVAGTGPFVNVPKPTIAIVNGGGIRADLQAGDISLQDTFSISPFGNVVSVVEGVTTGDLLLLLENAYSRTVDGPEPGIDPIRQGDGTGRFAQVSGFSVEYDILAQPLVLDIDGNVITVGERIRKITLEDGTVIVENGEVTVDMEFDIATASFLAQGGDQYFDADYLSQNYSFTSLGVTDQQSVADYISAFNGADLSMDSRYDGVADGRIVTIPEPNAAMLFLTGLICFVTRRRVSVSHA